MEVHVANPEYIHINVSGTTPVPVKDAFNGTWVVDGSTSKMYFIKTIDCDSNTVEVYQLNGDYTGFKFVRPTGFTQDNGNFTIDNDDLYCIKTGNPASGSFVEVWVARFADRYQNPVLLGTSAIASSDALNGVFTIRCGNLIFIKKQSTGSGHIEVHLYTGDSKYQTSFHYATWFDQADGKNGTWNIGNNDNLYFIKEINVASGDIEVHVATSADGYKGAAHYPTVFDDVDALNGGYWIV